VEVSMDDILIHASDRKRLDEVTTTVLKKLKAAGLKLNGEKCVFGVTRVKFLGHILTDKGLEVDDSKVEAISKLKKPGTVKQLRRLLGMVNYLGKFVRGLTDLTEPLRELTKTKVEWQWGPEQDTAFDNIKQALSVAPVLKYYDVNAKVTLQVDASSKAMSAVLMQDGLPVAYAAKAFTETQQNYPQIEKEASAVRFGCTKFHEYIYGKNLEIETDHKPLVNIFKKHLEDAPARLRRIMLDVLTYKPNLVYKKGSELFLADTFSRDCDVTPNENEPEDLEVLLVLDMTDPVREEMIAATARDEELQELAAVIQRGWPDEIDQVSKRIKKYWNFREELTTYQGLLFKGDRIVIPEDKINYAMHIAHLGHNGIQHAMRRARQSM
jgi:hypothetical protein